MYLIKDTFWADAFIQAEGLRVTINYFAEVDRESFASVRLALRLINKCLACYSWRADVHSQLTSITFAENSVRM
jgi:hypothetical protein